MSRLATEQIIKNRLKIILEKASCVFGDEQIAQEWLEQKIPSLGQKVPTELIVTEAGYDLVITTLCRIEYGVCG